MSLVSEQRIQDMSVIQDASVIPDKDEHGVHVYVEVSYSESRKKEMKKENETNCTLLISLLKDHLQRAGATDINTWTPKNKNRFADIVLEFKINDESKLDNFTKLLDDVGGSSIGKIEYFVSD